VAFVGGFGLPLLVAAGLQREQVGVVAGPFEQLVVRTAREVMQNLRHGKIIDCILAGQLG
jgi:hypothetical protein